MSGPSWMWNFTPQLYPSKTSKNPPCCPTIFQCCPKISSSFRSYNSWSSIPPRWWFQTFLEFSPLFGEDEPILTWAYFSNGLVQPPTRPPTSLFSNGFPRFGFLSVFGVPQVLSKCPCWPMACPQNVGMTQPGGWDLDGFGQVPRTGIRNGVKIRPRKLSWNLKMNP